MRGAVFPWREGNRFELLIDGPQFFPRMLVAIARAEGWRMLAYTVNDEWAAQRLIDLGLDGIITDAVDAFGPARQPPARACRRARVRGRPREIRGWSSLTPLVVKLLAARLKRNRAVRQVGGARATR